MNLDREIMLRETDTERTEESRSFIKQVHEKINKKISHEGLQAQAYSLLMLSFQPLLKNLRQFTSKFFNNNIQTLYDKYKYQSLAIISDSSDLFETNCRACSYKIPLMFVEIRDEEEEKLVWNKLLNSFETAQLLNQNFLFSGKLHRYPDPQNIPIRKEVEKEKEKEKGMISFYKNGQVYEKINLIDLLLIKSEEEIQETLGAIRNKFYEGNKQKEQYKTEEVNRIKKDLDAEKQPRLHSQSRDDGQLIEESPARNDELKENIIEGEGKIKQQVIKEGSSENAENYDEPL